MGKGAIKQRLQSLALVAVVGMVVAGCGESSEGAGPPPEGEESVLCDFLGQRSVPEDAPGQPVDDRTVSLDHFL